MKIYAGAWLAILLAAFCAGAASADEEKFSKQQLDQMLAPIALYPDDLLSNILMAATYPLDVVEAQRWRSAPENAKLQGDALVEALESKDWDPSIKALVQFPDVLKQMSDQLDWTQNLGEAFLNQQSEVMDEVQVLRGKAEDSGHLKSNSQQKVSKEDGGAYVIEPASPDTVYVPVYEPTVVYGSWWYPDYPPYYWGYPGAAYVDGFWWGAAGIAIAGGIWGWNHWDWRHRYIHIDADKWNHINHHNKDRMNSDRWKHDAHHKGAIRPHDKGASAEHRRQLSKKFRKDEVGLNKAKLDNKKPGAGNASRVHHNKQFHSPKRKSAGKPEYRAKRAIAQKPAHIRSFKASKPHGGRRIRRR